MAILFSEGFPSRFPRVYFFLVFGFLLDFVFTSLSFLFLLHFSSRLLIFDFICLFVFVFPFCGWRKVLTYVHYSYHIYYYYYYRYCSYFWFFVMRYPFLSGKKKRKTFLLHFHIIIFIR